MKSNRSRLLSSLIFASILLILVLPTLAHGASNLAYAATSTIKLKQSEFKLSVEPLSPVLPANGDIYNVTIQLQTLKDSKPMEAPYDLEIDVASSDSNIAAIVTPKITLKEGESSVRVPVKTTGVSGTVAISAQAAGVTAGVSSFSTLQLDTLNPSRIALYAAPAKVNPDPKLPGMLYVQLLNSQGLPALPKDNIIVLLASADPRVASVPSQVVITPGSTYALADITPGLTIGSVKITGSSPGLVSGETVVTIAGPKAEKIVVEFGPASIPQYVGFDALGTVQFRDSEGNPIKALETTKITLRSSDTIIAKVPGYVEIPAGKTYTSFLVSSRGGVGSASITASASGYETGIGVINTVDLSFEETSKLQLFVVPSVLPPEDGVEHQSIILQTQDGTGAPSSQHGWPYTSLVVSSSNPQYGSVSNIFSERHGYAIAPFTTTQHVGKTMLTVSREGLETAQLELEIKGAAPKALTLTQLPTVIQANRQSSESLVIGLDDGKGNPVPAREEVHVLLTSSDSEIATIQGFVTIPVGSSFATATVQTTAKPGESTITATSTSLTTGTLKYKTIGDTSPFTLGLYPVPKMLPSDGRTYDAVVVQLQDLSGNPTRALTDVPVSLSSSSLTAGTIQRDIIITKGSTYALGQFTTAERDGKSSTTLKDIEKFTVTASSQGYDSVTTELKVGSQPFTVTVGKVTAGEFESKTTVPVDVFSGSLPVKGATVAISGENAEVTTVLTDENGHAVGQYVPTMPGKNSVIVTVTKGGYLPFTKTQGTTLKQTIDLAIKATSEKGFPIDAKMTYTPPGGKETTKDATAGKPIQLTKAKFGVYTISAPQEIRASNGIYKFAGWSDGITENPRSTTIIEDSEVVALYSAKYLLQASSKYGSVAGTGWYSEGDKVTLSIQPTSVTGILTDSSFVGWSGDIRAGAATTTVTMNSPKSITADWSENYLKMILIIAGGAGAGGFILYKKKIKPAREAPAEDEKAPDLDWFKP